MAPPGTDERLPKPPKPTIFRPGAGSYPPVLAGRDEPVGAFRKVIHRLRDDGFVHENIGITGLRGVGKTVLLERYERMAEEAGNLTFIFEASRDGDFLARLSSKLIEFAKGLESSKEAVHQKVYRHLSRLLPTSAEISVPVGGAEPSIRLDWNRDRLDESEPQIESLFVKIAELAKNSGSGFVVGVDELQYLDDQEMRVWLNAVCAREMRKLPFLAIASGLPSYEKRIRKSRTNQERGFRMQTIEYLNRDGVEQAIAQPLQGRADVDGDAVDMIWKKSFGYPYFVQIWGERLWEELDSKRIDVDLVRNVGERIDAYLNRNFYSKRWDDLNEQEARYVRVVGHANPNGVARDLLSETLGIGLVEEWEIANSLIDQGIIHDTKPQGDRVVSLPSFHRYVSRTRPGPEPAWKRELTNRLSRAAFEGRRMGLDERRGLWIQRGLPEETLPNDNAELVDLMEPDLRKKWRTQLANAALSCAEVSAGQRPAFWKEMGMPDELCPDTEDEIAALCEAAGLPKPESNDIR